VSQVSPAIRARGLDPSVPRSFQRHAIGRGGLPEGRPSAARIVFGGGGEEGGVAVGAFVNARVGFVVVGGRPCRFGEA